MANPICPYIYNWLCWLFLLCLVSHALSLLSDSCPTVFHQVKILPTLVIKKEITTPFKLQLPHYNFFISPFTQAKLLPPPFFIEVKFHSRKSTILNWTIQCWETTASTYFLNISIIEEENRVLKKLSLLTLPFPKPLTTTNIFPVYTDLPLLDISDKSNHTHDLLCLVCFT